MTKPYIWGNESIIRGDQFGPGVIKNLLPMLNAGSLQVSVEAAPEQMVQKPEEAIIYRVKRMIPEPRMRLTVYFVNPAFHPMTYDVDGAWVATITDGRLEIKNQAVFAAGQWAYFEIEEIKDGE